MKVVQNGVDQWRSLFGEESKMQMTCSRQSAQGIPHRDMSVLLGSDCLLQNTMSIVLDLCTLSRIVISSVLESKTTE